MVKDPTATNKVGGTCFVFVLQLGRVEYFIRVSQVNYFTTVKVGPLALPFVFEFKGRSSIEEGDPQVFRQDSMGALYLTIGSSFLPSTPGRMALSIIFRDAHVGYPIVVFINQCTPFRSGLAFYEGVDLIFSRVGLIVIRITVIYDRMGVPFIISTVRFKNPWIVKVA